MYRKVERDLVRLLAGWIAVLWLSHWDVPAAGQPSVRPLCRQLPGHGRPGKYETVVETKRQINLRSFRVHQQKFVVIIVNLGLYCVIDGHRVDQSLKLYVAVEKNGVYLNFTGSFGNKLGHQLRLVFFVKLLQKIVLEPIKDMKYWYSALSLPNMRRRPGRFSASCDSDRAETILSVQGAQQKSAI